jgi:predicted deacylase
MKEPEKITLSFFLLVFLMSFVIDAYTQDVLTVGEVVARPGEKASGFIRVKGDDGGMDASIPITLIRGQRPGPVLALIAGIHGCEYASIMALQQLNRELDPAILSGTVILVLTAHRQSFLKRTVYYNPVDWQNLNRMFPGDPEGTMSQRIAHAITTQVIDQCDVLIDNHGGDANEDLAPFIFCTETGDQKTDESMRELAKVYGIPIVKKDTVSPGSLPRYTSHTAAMKGKPAITIESGRLGTVKEEDIVRVVKGSYNVMIHLDILEGEPEKTPDLQWIKESITVSSQYTGLFYPLVVSEEWVKKGQVVGRVTDFFGEIQQEVKAPLEGMVLYVVGTPPVSKGETLVSVVSFQTL